MGSSNVLSEKDANNSLKNLAGTGANKGDVKSMEYHRQVLQSKMEEERYGHAGANNTAIPTPTTAVGTSASSGTTTVAAAAKPLLASSASQMILNRTRAGLPADPNAPGASSSTHQYISPSDNIMSPCTAKLSAYKSRQAGKYVQLSIFLPLSRSLSLSPSNIDTCHHTQYLSIVR